MATYKSNAGAILQPGNQVNRLSSFNHEGVYGWPGLEAYELIGYHKVSTKSGSKASHKSFNITVPSPDRREGDRVRLQPANVNYQPIYPTQIEIQGVVIGVIRRL